MEVESDNHFTQPDPLTHNRSDFFGVDFRLTRAGIHPAVSPDNKTTLTNATQARIGLNNELSEGTIDLESELAQIRAQREAEQEAMSSKKGRRSGS